MKVKYSIVIICCFLTSCISYDYVKIREDIRTNLKANNHIKAIQNVNDKDYYSKDNSVLLKKLEQGTVHFNVGNYYQSLQYFDEAEKIAESLYTVKISSKLKGMINDNLDDYSGERYEISLLYFYKSLANYDLYLIGKYESYTAEVDGKKTLKKEKILTLEEKINHLRKARSNIMKWDSLLNSYKNESKKITDYNLDLLQKIWGAFIVEENGGGADIQRAKAMYKSAQKILNSNYLIYPTFNSNYDKFIKNKEIKTAQYTDFYVNMNNFINEKIKQLESYDKNNLVVLINENYVPFKKVKIVPVPMDMALFMGQSIDFFTFMRSIVVFSSLDGLPYFKIQLPYVEEYKIDDDFIAEIYKNNEKVKEFSVNLVEPIADILNNDFEVEKSALYTKITTSTLLQYATAIKASYELYKTMLDNNGNYTLALSLATMSYMASVKSIENLNRPDLRQWSTLPKAVRFGGVKLENGNYTLKIKSINKNVYIYNKNIEIKDDKSEFVNFRY